MVTHYRSFLLTLTATLSISFCMGALPASSRDNGQYAQVNPKIKSWIEGLKNGSGTPCCDTADGFALGNEEVVYDTNGGHYRVQIQGKWYVINDTQLLKEPNLLGRAIVWYYIQADGTPHIYCFIDGGGF